MEKRKIGWLWLVLAGFVTPFILWSCWEGVREAWAQARTVMYKDYAQTVEVAHNYDVAGGAPLVATGASFGIPATGFAPDMVGPSTVVGLGVGATLGRVRSLTNGGAVGGVVIDDGSEWNCLETKSQHRAIATCPPWNAQGNGAANDTTALQLALNSGLPVFIPKGTYLISGTLFATIADQSIKGEPGTVIRLMDGMNALMLSVAGVEGVEVVGITFDGNEAGHSGCGGGCRAISVSNGALRLTIKGNTFKDLENEGVRLTGAYETRVVDNNFVNIKGEDGYGAGITYTGPYFSQYMVVSGNLMNHIGGTGIGLGAARDGVVSENVINDSAKIVPQQAIVIGYGVDAITGEMSERVLVSNNVVNTTTLHGCIRVGGRDITVSNNTVAFCNERGIIGITTNDGVTVGSRIRLINNYVFRPTDSSPVNIGMQFTDCLNCELSGNHIEMLGTSIADGIRVGGMYNGRIAGNYVSGGNLGLRINDFSNLVIQGNQIMGSLTYGIYVTTGTDAPGFNHDLSLNWNTLQNGAAGSVVGGIYVEPTTVQASIVGNHITDYGSPLYGPASTYVASNYAFAEDCTISYANPLQPSGAQIGCDFLQVGAGGNITSIANGTKNRRLTVGSLGGVTLIDGGNLNMEGDFSMNPGDSISFVSDGIEWYETGRSAN